MTLPWATVEKIVERALVEDLAWGDVTTDLLVPREAEARASVLLKAEGVVCGLDVMSAVFRRVDPDTRVAPAVVDGARGRPGEVIALVHGRAASLLTAERVALNFLQRLSGIATATSRYVEAVAGLPVRIVETRKTTPGLRILEKYAVRVGGGHNHRQNLSDGILIKDNHLAVLRERGVSLAEAVRLARRRAPHTLRIEVEVDSLGQLEEALDAGADVVLLDNMTPSELREAVRLTAGRALLEASGGITLAGVRAVAEAGVDIISVGALTHSATALDISLEMELA